MSERPGTMWRVLRTGTCMRGGTRTPALRGTFPNLARFAVVPRAAHDGARLAFPVSTPGLAQVGKCDQLRGDAHVGEACRGSYSQTSPPPGSLRAVSLPQPTSFTGCVNTTPLPLSSCMVASMLSHMR